MNTLRMLGGIDLVDPIGHPVDVLLRQPKLIALLAYLAMPRPGTWHRRDTLLAAFWPDADQSRARTSLRNALYTLRRHLVDGAIRTRGADEVSVDPALVATDVAAMLDELAQGRQGAAIAHYRGDLLPALYIAEADGFGEWLEGERSRLKSLARKAAAQHASACEAAGDIDAAIDAARHATTLDPEDETAARRLIALLDKSGDRSQALATYEAFRTRLASEFGVEPSSETRAIVTTVKARETPSASITAVPPPAPPPAIVPLRIDKPENRRWWWIAAAAVIGASVLSASAILRKDDPPVSRSLVVLPMDNGTGDATLDYVSEGLAENVARRLEGIGGIEVRSGARSEWPQTVRRDYKTIAHRFGMTVLLRTSLTKLRDSLELKATIMDVASSTDLDLPTQRFTTNELHKAEMALVAAVAGAWFRVPLAMMPKAPERPVSEESHRLTMQGWHAQLRTSGADKRRFAKDRFDRAIALDPLNARAHSGLSTVHSAWTFQEIVPFESGLVLAVAASRAALKLDSLDGTALANLGLLTAMKTGSYNRGKVLLDSAARVDPSNAEVFLVTSALNRSAWKWDEAILAIRYGQALDPLTPAYFEREAFVESCRDSLATALKVIRTHLPSVPTNLTMLRQHMRLLALLGRYDEALAEWRTIARLEGDTALVQRLSDVRADSAGYWSARHTEGTRALRTLRARAKREWVAPLLMIRTQMEAGEHEAAFTALEARVLARDDVALSRLPCQPAYDEVRRTPRFRTIMNDAGPLPH